MSQCKTSDPAAGAFYLMVYNLNNLRRSSQNIVTYQISKACAV